MIQQEKRIQEELERLNYGKNEADEDDLLLNWAKPKDPEDKVILNIIDNLKCTPERRRIDN